MNPIDEQIERLLRAAGWAPPEAVPSSPPFGLEARVLAAWREGRAPSF